MKEPSRTLTTPRLAAAGACRTDTLLAMERHDEPRPRVTASFVEPDETAAPLLQAIGRVVLAVTGLEKCLQRWLLSEAGAEEV